MGGLTKAALRYTMLRDSDIPINSAESLVEAMKLGLEKAVGGSAKYQFVRVEAFPAFDRVKKAGLPIKGIQALHSFVPHKGGLLTSQLSCLNCTVSGLCEECMAATPDVSAAQATPAIGRQEEFGKLAAKWELEPEVSVASEDEVSADEEEVAVEVEWEDEQEVGLGETSLDLQFSGRS